MLEVSLYCKTLQIFPMSQSTSLLMKYQKMISKRYEQVKATGDGVITRDDLNFFSLSMFAAMESQSFKRRFTE